jgi:hypothetical protein
MGAAALCLLAVGPYSSSPAAFRSRPGCSPCPSLPAKQASLDREGGRNGRGPWTSPSSGSRRSLQPVTLVPGQHDHRPVRHASPPGSLPSPSSCGAPRAQPVDAVTLELDVMGPRATITSTWPSRSPCPLQGVSVLKVTPELLEEPCRERYLMAPTDVFAADRCL